MSDTQKRFDNIEDINRKDSDRKDSDTEVLNNYDTKVLNTLNKGSSDEEIFDLSMTDYDFFDGIQKYFGESKIKPEQYSALALAYIGDGVFDLIIRTIIIDLGNGKVKDFHRITSGIVKASSQAKIVKMILDELTDEEMMIYKHGRNAKSATSAKNASIIDYRVATGFEALIGYLYLSHKMDRALELVKKGMEKGELIPTGIARSGKYQ